MELIELRHVTRKHFCRETVDITDMLFVLLSLSSSDIEEIFGGEEEQKQKMLEAVSEYKKDGNTIPQSALTGAICGKKDGAFTDIDLLEYVLSEDSEFSDTIKKNGVNTDLIMEKITLQKNKLSQKAQNISIKNDFEAMCENMTRKAEEGLYGHLTGRGAEISAIENILLRKDKANVILTGDAGVGKTALVELLVKNSVTNKNSLLSKYTFYNLDITDLVSGTAYRGELEQKMAKMLDLAAREGDAVFFIDEIHRINQASDGISSGSQIGEILKPYLSKDNLRIIGASTTEEYQRYIARSPALMRRFQQIKIDELSGEALTNVLRSCAKSLSEYHGIKIEDDIVRFAKEITDEYVKNRYQPDKAKELIDSACVLAAKSGSAAIDESHIIDTLSSSSGIPKHILNKKVASAAAIAEKIKAKIFGQDKQVDVVTDTIMVKMAGFKKSDSPLAAFLFAGDSGVGKTYLAGILAEEILSDKSALSVIDMAEYSERHSVSKLVGSPPGYVNSEQEGVLCKALSRNSFSIILFDEIEKASAEVYKLLLGMMDTGRIKSGIGTEYNADNAILIFTTNAVTTKKINRHTIGFAGSGETEASIMDELKDVFPVEFLGRIDDIIMFNKLENDDYRKIIIYNIDNLVNSFAQKGIKIIGNTQSAAEYVLSRFNLKEMGVRAVMEIVRKKITAPIVSKMALHPDEDIEIDINEIIAQQRESY
ncbi:MAG: ATP-dependent Clp protease ATP-binding subunit [Eubacteriales bacterium]